MAKGIEFTFISETRDMLRGTKDIEKALEAVEDSVDDVAKSGNDFDAGDAMAADMKAGGTKAERALEELQDKLRETEKKGKIGRGMGDEIGDGIRKGTKRGEEGFEELRDEANSTAKESAASFDGSFESALDSVQEILANAFAGFGPLGAVAGLALAAGLGAAITAGQDAADAVNDTKVRVGELAEEIVQAGGDISQVDLASRMREWGVEIQDQRELWELWQDSAKSNIDHAADAATRAGLDFKTMFRALSGNDAAATERALSSVNSQIEDLEDKIRSARGAGNLLAGLQDEDGIALNSLRGIRRELTGVKDERGAAQKAAELLQKATEDETAAAEANAAAEAAASAATEARNAAISSLQSGLDSAVSSYGEFINAESGATDPGAYVASMRERIEATSGFSSRVAGLAQEFGLSQAETQAILDQGVDFGPMLASIQEAGLAPEFINQIRAAVGGGQELLDGAGLGTTVDVDADPSKAEGKLAETEGKSRSAEIEADAETGAAAKELDSTASKARIAKILAVADVGLASFLLGVTAAVPRTARITAVASTGQASADLDAIASRRRTTTIVARVVDRTGKEVN